MKNRKIAFGVVLVLLCYLCFVFLPLKEKRVLENSSEREARPDATRFPVLSLSGTANSARSDMNNDVIIEKVIDSLSAPIVFYGRVTDQSGVPVRGALVTYTVLDKFAESGTTYNGTSDSDGCFSIDGVTGGAISIGVQKSGYYMIDGRSSGSFAYGIARDSTLMQSPTKDAPAVFVLQKAGAIEALHHVSSIQIDVPVGMPVFIDLETGQSGGGDLRVVSFVGDLKVKPYEWTYELSVQGGGLVERKNEFDFEAPIDGYEGRLVIASDPDDALWSPGASKDYFAKLNDGRHARFSVRFYPRKRNFLVIESFMNPAPGNRSLESDPERLVRPK